MVSAIKGSFTYGVIIMILLMIGGCHNNTLDNENTKDILINSLNNGAVLKSQNGEYDLYNYIDASLVKVSSQNAIVAYNKQNNVYIKYEEGKSYAVYKNKKINIDEDYEELKLSPQGRYLSYFIEDNGLKLKIYDIIQEKSININSDTLISGTLYDWYDDNKLIYYGIGHKKDNGIFMYDLDNNKENILYKINNGFLNFLKCTKNNVNFLHIDNNNNKEFLSIDKEKSAVVYKSKKIENINDIEEVDSKIYFMGKVIDDAESLYLLDSSGIRRIIFDFPYVIKCSKGLKIDRDGNAIFIGCDSLNGNEKIYRYNIDGTVEVIGSESVEYTFIEGN